MLLGTRLQLLETVVQRVVSQGCSDGVQWMRHILASGLHAVFHSGQLLLHQMQ